MVITVFAVCHTLVVVTSVNSLRNYHRMDTGKTFVGSIRDPEAFSGKYFYWNFTECARSILYQMAADTRH